MWDSSAQQGPAVPLSNHAAPASYCFNAHLLQINRLGHVFEQADSSSRTERCGDPGRLRRFRHDNEMLTGQQGPAGPFLFVTQYRASNEIDPDQ
jgi:hypothetical protein